jgi:hypothetical protein
LSNTHRAAPARAWCVDKPVCRPGQVHRLVRPQAGYLNRRLRPLLNRELGVDGNSGAMPCYLAHDSICPLWCHARLATSILINSGRYCGVQFFATCSSL